MSHLLRRWFTRKPSNHLVEISDRIYVLDCCFSTEAWDEEEYKSYTKRVSRELNDYYPVGITNYLVLNFSREAGGSVGSNSSIILDVLSEQHEGIAVIEYPRLYENCPIIPVEIFHHILLKSQNWVTSHQQVLLLLCERGGWPTLALVIAGLMMRMVKRGSGGIKEVLEMAYGFAGDGDEQQELVRVLCCLDPRASQMRYLGYVCEKGLEWLDKELVMERVVIRGLLRKGDEIGWGCRPVVRVYGRVLSGGRGTKQVFSSKKSDVPVGHYLEVEHLVVEMEIGTLVQGDIVIECSSSSSDHSREEMMFRVAFHTAFVHHSNNLLLLTRDEVDVLWASSKHQLPPDFEVEILFSNVVDVAPSIDTIANRNGRAQKLLPVGETKTENHHQKEDEQYHHDHQSRVWEFSTLLKQKKIPPPAPPSSPRSRKAAVTPSPLPIEISEALIKSSSSSSSSQSQSQLPTSSPPDSSSPLPPLPPPISSAIHAASPSSLNHTIPGKFDPLSPEVVRSETHTCIDQPSNEGQHFILKDNDVTTRCEEDKLEVEPSNQSDNLLLNHKLLMNNYDGSAINVGSADQQSL